jgi:hypothetical protein
VLGLAPSGRALCAATPLRDGLISPPSAASGRSNKMVAVLVQAGQEAEEFRRQSLGPSEAGRTDLAATNQEPVAVNTFVRGS